MQRNFPFLGTPNIHPSSNMCNNMYSNMFIPPYGQYAPCNNSSNCIPAPGCHYPQPIPELRGEGELISIVYPDGSLQFFFMPTTLQWTATISGSCMDPCNQAWHVRNVLNPIPASLFQQYYPHLAQYANANNCFRFGSPCNNPLYQNKFHQDGWSSTTDLQYFFPSLRISEWIPKNDATVQIITPIEKRDIKYEIVNVPCKCDKQQCRSAPKKPSIECMAVDEPICQTKYKPTCQPKHEPICQPASQPICQPALQPKLEPTSQPKPETTCQPKTESTCQPTLEPVCQPKQEPIFETQHETKYEPQHKPNCEQKHEPVFKPKHEDPCTPLCLRPVMRKKPSKSVNFHSDCTMTDDFESESSDASSYRSCKNSKRCRRKHRKHKKNFKCTGVYCCCGCEEVTDKSVTTYAEQKCGAEASAGCGTNTQTVPSSSRHTDTPDFVPVTSDEDTTTSLSDSEEEHTCGRAARTTRGRTHGRSYHDTQHCAICPTNSPLYFSNHSSEHIKNEITYSDNIM